MKYALVNNEKVEAVKGQVGICSVCGSTVIAKCGNYKINHWAHKTKQNCDAWWENETIWHRNWKNYFAVEWQEKIFTDDATGEKHIADICTDSNLVIEFQHSAIKPEEKISRENFYKNMLWVVDGTRLKNDYPKFQNGTFELIGKPAEPTLFLCHNPQSAIPKMWRNSNVPILFDFLGLEENIPQNDIRQFLFCVLPVIVDNKAIIVRMTRSTFIYNVQNDAILNYLNNLTREIPELYRKLKNMQTQRLVQHQLRLRYTRRRFSRRF
ncbi:MAG: hypothetical protein IJD57_01465 [Candidatus Gastranaerophilales bacterium]|nr:hypothetical protein [Candidatus Gastranaerophilales bacterium]